MELSVKLPGLSSELVAYFYSFALSTAIVQEL
jgi:hypothetical protein